MRDEIARAMTNMIVVALENDRYLEAARLWTKVANIDSVDEIRYIHQGIEDSGLMQTFIDALTTYAKEKDVAKENDQTTNDTGRR